MNLATELARPLASGWLERPAIVQVLGIKVSYRASLVNINGLMALQMIVLCMYISVNC